MRVAIYARISKEDQSTYSLGAQVEECMKKIEALNHQHVETYIDDGYSAKNMNRPQLQQMLQDLRAKKFELVCIWRLDRLTRSTLDGLSMVINIFKPAGVDFISVTEDIDTTSSDGMMMFTIRLSMAQNEREKIAERVILGQMKRVREGLRNTSSRPYGYDAGINLILSINEYEADIVRRIFEWYVQGHGLNKIAYMLNEEGIVSPGGSIWRERNIGDIVDNITYTGAVHWKRKKDPEDMRIIVHDVHEPIISKETFELAQEIRSQKKEHNMNQSSYDFPFSTIVKCGECGRSYHGKIKSRAKSWHKKTRHYRCSGKYRQDSCGASDISEDKLTGLFLEFLSRFDIEADEPERTISKTKDAVKEKKRLEKLIETSLQAKKNYSRAMGSGKITYEDFCSLIDEENAKLEKWQNELAELAEVQPERKRTRSDILSILRNLREEWPSMTVEQQKMNVQRLFRFLVIKKYDKNEWRIVAYKVYE